MATLHESPSGEVVVIGVRILGAQRTAEIICANLAMAGTEPNKDRRYDQYQVISF